MNSENSQRRKAGETPLFCYLGEIFSPSVGRKSPFLLAKRAKGVLMPDGSAEHDGRENTGGYVLLEVQ